MAFTSHLPCAQLSGLYMWLRRITMSDGESPAIAGSEPPNMTACPAPSMWLFSMRKGPGPFQPATPCESNPLPWHSASHESITASAIPLKATQRLSWSVGVPWMYMRSSTIWDGIRSSVLSVRSPVPSTTRP